MLLVFRLLPRGFSNRDCEETIGLPCWVKALTTRPRADDLSKAATRWRGLIELIPGLTVQATRLGCALPVWDSHLKAI